MALGVGGRGFGFGGEVVGWVGLGKREGGGVGFRGSWDKGVEIG